MGQIPRLPEVATGAMATPVNGRSICMPDATVECHNPHLIICNFGLFGNKGRSQKYYTFRNLSITTFLKLVPSYSHILVVAEPRSKNICQTTFRGTIELLLYIVVHSVNRHTSSSLERIIHEPGKGNYTIFLCLWCTPMIYDVNTLIKLYILIN